nr:hypothetical protein [uncultured Allomuricauda sp.]
MRKLFFLLATLFCISGFSQEAFKKHHRIRAKYNFKAKLQKVDGKITSKNLDVVLMQDKYIKYMDLNEESKERKAIEEKIKKLKEGLLTNTTFYDSEGGEIIAKKEQVINPEFLKTIYHKGKEVPGYFKLNPCQVYKGNVLFEKEKVYVNLWNFPKETDASYEDAEKTAYYQLKDGQTIKLGSREWTATALTIPFKYRPKDSENDAIDNVFSTSFNAGIYLGYSLGWTKFNHRKKIGNRTIVNKVSFGGFVGPATEEVTVNNSNATAAQLGMDEKETIGLFSRGFGILYSRNKIAVGFFMGWDMAIGELGDDWNYGNRLWLGAGIGYDLFKI